MAISASPPHSPLTSTVEGGDGEVEQLADAPPVSRSACISIISAYGAGRELQLSLHPSVLSSEIPFIVGLSLVNTRFVEVVNEGDCDTYFCFDANSEEREILQSPSLLV